MSESGFSSKSTESLFKIRANLLSGLEKVDKSLDDETFEIAGEKGSAPPSQSGRLTLGLLLRVQEVLTERGHPFPELDKLIEEGILDS
jgi:hypothetical protein